MSDAPVAEPPQTYSGRVQEFGVTEWRRSPRDRCPLCGTSEWTYEGLYEVRGLSVEHLERPRIPAVLVIECNGCGYLAEISAASGTGPVPSSLRSALNPCRPLGSSANQQSGPR